MSEDRIRALEVDVADLRVSNAQLAVSIDHLVKAVDALSLVVQQQRDMLNQGRGVLWAVMFAAGAIGAVVTTLVKKLFGF